MSDVTTPPGASGSEGLRPLLDRTIQPPYVHAPYASTVLRGPKRPLMPLPHGLSDVTGPAFGESDVSALDADMSRNAVRNGEPLGERMVVTGRLLDERGKPVRGALVEAWQANAAGRYIHKKDQHDAPLDPNFSGCGRCLTDDDGRYRFTTIKPGAYPWRNHANAWRPPHIHFSVFGRMFHQRLITQMFFPGDPLLAFDPIFQGIPDEAARARLVSHFDLDVTQPLWALGYRFDIVLAGPLETPFEEPHA
jgi:protocatechuate 3,4-dioxygenase beta subunit